MAEEEDKIAVLRENRAPNGGFHENIDGWNAFTGGSVSWDSSGVLLMTGNADYRYPRIWNDPGIDLPYSYGMNLYLGLDVDVLSGSDFSNFMIRIYWEAGGDAEVHDQLVSDIEMVDGIYKIRKEIPIPERIDDGFNFKFQFGPSFSEGTFTGVYTVDNVYISDTPGDFFDDTTPSNGDLHYREVDGIYQEYTIVPPEPVDQSLKWDQTGERLYEAGVDQVVLYTGDSEGVAWNGVVSIAEDETIETSPLYFAGEKFKDVIGNSDFSVDLIAYSAPKEFDACNGVRSLAPGLLVTNQPRTMFGLVYRTLIGNDLELTSYGYKIHLLYNAVAIPSKRTNATTESRSEAVQLQWTINAVPETIEGIKPTAHLIIDSTQVDAYGMKKLEDVLYGSLNTPPTLPPPNRVIELLQSEEPEEIPVES